MFGSINDPELQVHFYLSLVDSKALEGPNASRLLEDLLKEMVHRSDGGHVPWSEFFDKRFQRIARIRERLTDQSAVLSAFWTQCLQSLKESCLVPGNDDNMVLRGLLKNAEEVSIRWACDPRRCHDQLEHWRRVSDLLQKPARPGKPDWHALRWSLTTLGIGDESGVVLKLLVEQVARSVPSLGGYEGEIIDTGRAMGKIGPDVIPSADYLLAACSQLPDASRANATGGLFCAFCGDSEHRVGVVLRNFEGGLSEEVVSMLETSREKTRAAVNPRGPASLLHRLRLVLRFRSEG